jgi:nitroreductase
MTIIESIRSRRSVRTYDGRALTPEHVADIERFTRALAPPFRADAQIRLIHRPQTGDKPAKLGTYGWIGGARDYLALVHRPGSLAEEGAAYIFEQTVLHCTALGIGTCWLGGSFSRTDFKRQVMLQPGEKMSIVSPAGYPANRRRFVETWIVGAEKNHRSRKPFEANFFLDDFKTPLTRDAAGAYELPLEMVRLAPSANNSQPWRILLARDAIHFYRAFSYGFACFDLGIALCHFAETCRELHIPGHFKILPAPCAPDATYAVSFSREV